MNNRAADRTRKWVGKIVAGTLRVPSACYGTHGVSLLRYDWPAGQTQPAAAGLS